MIRRLTHGDSDGDSRAVTYEEAVGAAVAGNLSSSGAPGSVESGASALVGTQPLLSEDLSVDGDVAVSAELRRVGIIRSTSQKTGFTEKSLSVKEIDLLV